VRSSLYAAMDESARDFLPGSARQALTWLLAEVFEYRVAMSRDLQQGDEFRVLAERSVAPNGAVRIDRVLAASLGVRGSVIRAVRFPTAAGRAEYYDDEGKSLRAAFLREPLEFRRISSNFGLRVHPILGDRRLHRGTDYAAPSGTPVRAIGDGIVVRASWGNGYGNVLELRHPNGYVTRYAHLKGFAAGVRAGKRVSIGQTVAYVGSTGMSTAPHLHFEVLVNGQQRDPRSALQRTSGNPIAASERQKFMSLRDRLLASLDGASHPVAVLGSATSGAIRQAGTEGVAR
jgi:murein DD-endopeptidase MepM/ murein hydrolase activator NlpD